LAIPENGLREKTESISKKTQDTRPLLVEPDLEFVRSLGKRGGVGFKKCIQCGTCAGTCTLSPDEQAFPCKEMSWATWGMKQHLLEDIDVWLCHQCNDCSTQCPRGAQPGDILSAIRQDCVQHYSSPRFLARWANQPQGLLLLLGISAFFLVLALKVKEPLENILGFSEQLGDRIVYAYSSVFPHWLLNIFFGLFSFLTIILAMLGVIRFWKTLNRTGAIGNHTHPVKGIWASIGTTLKSIIIHDKFSVCERSHPRLWSHMLVFFGFAALTVVTLWVIMAGLNPLLKKDFIYPFGLFSPWKLLANAGGLALLIGLALMTFERAKDSRKGMISSYSDWIFLTILGMVVISGFVTEVLHYVRLEPHRHVAYFTHLLFVFSLLMYMPFSKFAHIVYRTTAMVYSEYYGRKIGQYGKPNSIQENMVKKV
jgi:quinone-modifying oxidoreductase subunit QmoC